MSTFQLNTYAQMDYEERKKKMLLNLARSIGPDSFKNLRCLYINELPYSIKIDTPIQLFHYLDIGNTIGLKLLLHNLNSVDLDLLTKELDQFIKDVGGKKDNEISIQHFFRSLKDGLRIVDIKKINYILGTIDSTDFTLILCDLVFYYGRHCLNWTGLWSVVAKFDEKLFKSLILPELEKISKKWPIIDEFKYKENCLKIEIGHQLSKRNVEELLFFYKIPQYNTSDKMDGLDLLFLLEKGNKITLQELGTYLEWMGRNKFQKKIIELEKEKSKELSSGKGVLIQSGNPLKIMYNHCSISLIKEIAKSQKLCSHVTEFDELLLSLINLTEGKTIDLTQIKSFLVQIERFDLIKIAERVGRQRNATVLTEHRKLLPDEYKIFHLLEKLDPMTTRELAFAYGLKNVSTNFAGELLQYLIANGMTDIDILKRNLTKIDRADLIGCLDVPLNE